MCRHMNTCAQILTEASCSQMRFVSAAAKPDKRERWSFLMLQLGPHCLGKQTRMNISVRRSPWVPTCMVGAWHTYRHTYRYPRTHRQFTVAARIIHLPVADATIITSVSLRKRCQLLCSLSYCTRLTV